MNLLFNSQEHWKVNMDQLRYWLTGWYGCETIIGLPEDRIVSDWPNVLKEFARMCGGSLEEICGIDKFIFNNKKSGCEIEGNLRGIYITSDAVVCWVYENDQENPSVWLSEINNHKRYKPIRIVCKLDEFLFQSCLWGAIDHAPICYHSERLNQNKLEIILKHWRLQKFSSWGWPERNTQFYTANNAVAVVFSNCIGFGSLDAKYVMFMKPYIDDSWICINETVL